MSKFGAITKLISSDFFGETATEIHNSKCNFIKLREGQNYWIKINFVDPESISIKLDDDSTIPVCLPENYRNRCDYVLLTRQNDIKTAIFIELKSSSKSEHNVADQLRGGACFFDYLNSTTQYFLNSDVLDNYKKFFVFIYKKPRKKVTIKKKKNTNLVNTIKFEESKIPITSLVPNSKFLKVYMRSRNNVSIEKIFSNITQFKIQEIPQ